ncbi:MAG: M20/M25/M40 family metallo-hydrolase [Bacteroidota bacterium]
MRLLIPLLAGALLLAPRPTCAQPDQERLSTLAHQAAADSYDLLYEVLSIPNDANDPAQVDANIAWTAEAFATRGFLVRELNTEGPPLLLAQRPRVEGLPTLLIYLQIDGQPVDPSAWDQEDPYRPVLKAYDGAAWQPLPWERLDGPVDPEWRVFARSASDAKGPVAMLLATLDAMEAEGLDPTFNIKVIMDFEEELGSPNLPGAVPVHREALAADALLIFDGPRHPTNQPMLTFGARGIALVTLTVYGARVSQHSGHYGNYAPNPGLRLAQLLASMKDEAGRVTLPGFYDGITITDATRALLAEVPDDEASIQRDLGIAAPDGVAPTLQEAIQYPSLNVRGLNAGWVGREVRTIVPATATAEIDVRIVPESDPERLVGLIRSHVEAAGYHLTDGPPTDAERMAHPRLASFTSRIAYGPFRTPMDAGVGAWLTDALTRAFGHPPIRKRISGGSIPISPFVNTLGIPAVTVPTVNADNNQHSPNENLRLGNYREGIQTFLAILTQPVDW